MKHIKISLFIFFFCAFSFYTFAQTQSEEKAKFEALMKETKNFSNDYMVFSAKDYLGNFISSDSLKGFNVFYMFGDSQCPPCLGLAKTINSFINEKRYEGKNIKFAFITYDNEKGINRLRNVYKLKFDYFISMSIDEMKQVGLIQLVKPTYLLVDKEGKVVFKGVGFSDKLDEAKKIFEKKLSPEIDSLFNAD